MVLDMPAILSKMHCDALRTSQLSCDRSPNGVGFITATGLAKRGDVIDIDTEMDHEAERTIVPRRLKRSALAPFRKE